MSYIHNSPYCWTNACKEFRKAIKSGEIYKVNQCIKDTCPSQEELDRALFVSVGKKNMDCVLLLLSFGARFDSLNGSILMCASTHSRFYFMKAFKEFADKNNIKINVSQLYSSKCDKKIKRWQEKHGKAIQDALDLCE